MDFKKTVINKTNQTFKIGLLIRPADQSRTQDHCTDWSKQLGPGEREVLTLTNPGGGPMPMLNGVAFNNDRTSGPVVWRVSAGQTDPLSEAINTHDTLEFSDVPLPELKVNGYNT